VIAVIIPTHNPDPVRLGRVLVALRQQDLPVSEWELIVVDNGSDVRLTPDSLDLGWHATSRIVREECLGLTHARVRGFREAHGELCVLVDDDNVLRSDYISNAARIATAEPEVGVFGGKSLADFSTPPPRWLADIAPMLGLRDDGEVIVVASWSDRYPLSAPIGAGMVIRREVALAWAEEIEQDPRRRALDRAGSGLASGGDNDIVISVMKAGWKMGYFPQLALTHLIPPARCKSDYLERLSHAMSRSWMQLLTIHGINPWPPISAWTVPLRQAKAWFTHRAWSGPAERIRWAGACGHFEGRVLPPNGPK
jgi:glycosyltransferase involved in cell wall biosynthesis